TISRGRRRADRYRGPKNRRISSSTSRWTSGHDLSWRLDRMSYRSPHARVQQGGDLRRGRHHDVGPGVPVQVRLGQRPGCLAGLVYERGPERPVAVVEYHLDPARLRIPAGRGEIERAVAVEVGGQQHVAAKAPQRLRGDHEGAAARVEEHGQA